MPRYFLRIEEAGAPGHFWAERVNGELRRVSDGGSTADLIEAVQNNSLQSGDVIAEPEPSAILSPITTPTQLICQFANYASHLREGGRDPAKVSRNVIFAKAASSIGPPNGAVIRPKAVTLLDYEIEIGLVIGRSITEAVEVDAGNQSDFLAGLVLTNDLSARNVQIPEQQAFKGKSYRGFTPCGPLLALFQPEDWVGLDDLQLRTWVNGELRQDEVAADMVFKPAETLSELSGVMDLHPGDLILTGTPGGTALKAPNKIIMTIGKFLPEKRAIGAFLSKQQGKREYLRPGDRVRCAISTANGAINLGEQNFTIADHL